MNEHQFIDPDEELANILGIDLDDVSEQERDNSDPGPSKEIVIAFIRKMESEIKQPWPDGWVIKNYFGGKK
jgi:hypothetical protein